MQLSSKGHYGLLALAELVESYKTRHPVQVKEIAENRKIPPQYLGQIMVLLKRGRLVHGARGPSGGYMLARAPENITVREVIHTLEGPMMGFELRGQLQGANGSIVTQRLTQTWTRGVRAMETVLEETTLADLCKPEQPALMYYI